MTDGSPMHKVFSIVVGAVLIVSAQATWFIIQQSQKEKGDGKEKSTTSRGA